MPRQAREKSSSGIYHIILRGTNKQDIFNDEEDYQRFIETLKKYKNISGYDIYGYCLMSNHIHLLIKEGTETISQIMKRIGTSYVYWYNNKYQRYGPLFQDRYKSENVEDDRYLLVVLRYIHQNPKKAGIVRSIGDYKWSSYSEYIRKENCLTNIEVILDIINNNENESVEIYKGFMEEESIDQCMDEEGNKFKQTSDEEARRIIQELIQSDNPQMIQQLDRIERDGVIRDLKAKGLSIRQLARITGVGRRIIEKA